MSGPAHSGLLVFAKELDRLAHFYESVLGLSRLKDSEELIVLQGQDIQLLVHAIPPHIASGIQISSPPRRREDTALKFFFTVPSISAARITAADLAVRFFRDCGMARDFAYATPVTQKATYFRFASVRPNNSFKPKPPRSAIVPDALALISASDTAPGGSA